MVHTLRAGKSRWDDRNALPTSAASIDAKRIPIFAISSGSPSPNARAAMKSDIVKPIPHRQPAPKICLQELWIGGMAMLALLEHHAKRKMPTGFPTIRPTAIPRVIGSLAAGAIL